MRNKAFTLIELLVVISIVALLGSIVLASVNSARDRGRIAAGRQFETNIYHAEADQANGIWDFDECSGTTTADRSGNGNVGTLVGTPTWSSDTPSNTGCSIIFNGSSQYISLANINFEPTYTISAWVNLTNSGQNTILDNISCGGPACLGFSIASGKVRLGYDFASSITGNILVNNGKWNLVAVTFDGANTNLYVNGVLDITSTAQGVRTASNHCGSIGLYYRCGSGGGNYFAGLIDNVRLFNKTLTASDIGALYAEGLGSRSFTRK